MGHYVLQREQNDGDILSFELTSLLSLPSVNQCAAQHLLRSFSGLIVTHCPQINGKESCEEGEN